MGERSRPFVAFPDKWPSRSTVENRRQVLKNSVQISPSMPDRPHIPNLVVSFVGVVSWIGRSNPLLRLYWAFKPCEEELIAHRQNDGTQEKADDAHRNESPNRAKENHRDRNCYSAS